MKTHTLAPLLVILPLMLTALSTNAQAKRRGQVAIMQFDVSGIAPGRAQALAITLTNVVAAEVTRIGYQVISSQDIEAMLSFERQKDLLGCDDDTLCLAEIGGALGTDLMVAGSVSQVGESLTLSLTLIDTRRASAKQRFQGTAGSEEALLTTAKRAVGVIFGQERDLSGTGVLYVTTSPMGAEVFLNSRSVGVAPVTLDGVHAGEHLIEVRKGTLRARKTVRVRPSSIEKVNLTLEASPPVPLMVFSSPSEAEVFIDGASMGATPVALQEVKTGERLLELHLEHYQSHKELISLSYDAYEAAGKVPIKHEVTLFPKPVRLTVEGLLPDATLTLNGEIIAPSALVPPGRHTLRASAPGYTPQEQDISIEIAQPSRLQMVLTLTHEHQLYHEQLNTKRTWVHATLWPSIALGLAGGSTWLWGNSARSNANQAYDSYLGASDRDSAASRWPDVEQYANSARQRQTIAIGLWSAAIVSAGVALYSYLTYPSAPVKRLSLDGDQ